MIKASLGFTEKNNIFQLYIGPAIAYGFFFSQTHNRNPQGTNVHRNANIFLGLHFLPRPPKNA